MRPARGKTLRTDHHGVNAARREVHAGRLVGQAVLHIGHKARQGEVACAHEGANNPSSRSSIETALNAMMFGFTPAWSVLSVESIAAFPKPRLNTIKRLTVIIDSDD